MIFHPPSVWFLLLLLLLPTLWWRSRRRPAVAFSSLMAASHVKPSWAVRLRFIVPTLRLLAVALLIVAIARPQLPNEQSRVIAEGIAIQLILDRSGSMRAQDFELDGKPADRMAASKRVIQEFIEGKGDLAGRPNDLVGLIAFARYADSMCPLTLDHSHVLKTLEQVHFVLQRSEDGTAIGDAIALGVERLHQLTDKAEDRGARPPQSNVIILLTDGESNVGDIDPVTAAEMAAAFGIRVYTIGAGSLGGMAPVPIPMLDGRVVTQNVPVSIDEATLREIAQHTGGRYFRATDTDRLIDIYSEIDRLEKTRIEETRYVQYGEPAVEQFTIAGVALPPLLAIVFGLLLLETLCVSTRWRTLP
jgi:Ca-activated chloride channel family protein